MWQELSEEGSATGSMACAAANAAAALAHGGPLPPGTAAAVRRNSVPGLLTLDVQLPAWKHRGLDAGAPSSARPGADGLNEREPGSPRSSNKPTVCAPASPTTAGGSPRSNHSRASSPGRYSGGDPTTLHMAMGCGGYPQGTCTFTLSSPASEAERQHLASFCGRLGCELERARYHLAKQQLEVSAAGTKGVEMRKGLGGLLGQEGGGGQASKRCAACSIAPKFSHLLAHRAR